MLRPMPRTRSAEYEDKQQSILDGAAELFAERGFAGTTIEAIARSLNASKAWLYHYYDAKEAVLYALLKDHVERLLRVAEDALAAPGTPQTRLRRLVGALIEVYADARAKHVVLMNELGALPAEQRAELRMLQNRLVDRFQSIIAEIRPDIAASEQHRRPTTMLLMGMMNWTYTWYRPEGPLSPTELADLVTNLFLSGIARVATNEETRT